MCGIVGYVGSRLAKEVLLEGLNRLEYRGYDSAGMALYSESKKDFVTRRSVGAVASLEALASDIGLSETQGIAHTRWATHGVPSEANAHPHRTGQIVLVHNGIIENHAELKARFLAKGIQFLSQTDTEVFAWLLESHRESLVRESKKGFSELSRAEQKQIVLRALASAAAEVEGHFAVVFMVLELPGVLFGLQKGAPLIGGLAKGESFLASDIQAVLRYTREVVYFPVGSVVVADVSGFEFFSIETLKPIQLERETIAWGADQIAKDGFDHFMQKEIFQQPMVVADTLSGRLPTDAAKGFLWDDVSAHKALWKDVKKIHLIACGTAYHAALVAKYMIERWARIPVETDFASEFRYRQPVFEKGAVVGVISQSGETADTLAALRLANEAGLPTFSICNVPKSTIARESRYQYPTQAGPEIGVASTKAFTAQLTVIAALAQDLALLQGRPVVDLPLSRLPHDMEAVLARSDEFEKIGASLKDNKTILFVGRGVMYPIALEGALKLKEITYRHAEGYAAGELKHGPIALVDRDLAAIVLAPTDELLHKTLSNLEEIRSRGAKIIGVGSHDNDSFRKLCDHYIPMPNIPWGLTPLIYVLPLQLISYGLARALDCSIDKPRNLAKSVTVE
jgi:glucosamine--fructose-6-phosphate aminotransferase (isomerizing)